MKVILLEEQQKLGALGAIVRVKAGYARNYLIPQHKAKFATKENIMLFAKEKVTLEKKAVKILEDAQKQKKAMQDLVCTLEAQARDEGKLFGSINTAAIATALSELGFNVEKRNIQLPNGLIRHTGEYEVLVTLHSQVSIAVKVIVNASHH